MAANANRNACGVCNDGPTNEFVCVGKQDKSINVPRHGHKQNN